MTPLASYLENFRLRSETTLFERDDTQEPTVVDSVSCAGMAVPRFTNEFWTARQRQSHSLQEVSYRACFKAELPRFFIELLTQPGDLVYDPFMGRGTTLIEAALLGRRVAGNDINPLSRILVEPRLNPPDIHQVGARLDSIPWDSGEEADFDLSMFFSPATQRMIFALRTYLADRKQANAEDSVDKWIRMVATNRLTGHSPGFFSVYTMPPNQAVSAESQKKINEARGQTPPDRDVAAIILKKSRALLKDLSADDFSNLQAAAPRFFNCPAETRNGLEDNAVDLVVTSPPFLDIVQYADDNWLRCWFNGIDAGEVVSRMTISRTVAQWSEVMGKALAELHRVLRPGGWVAFEVGEVRKKSVMLDEVIAPLGVSVGFACRGIVVNQQDFTKTANCWGVKNNSHGTNTNRIVLFQKTEQPSMNADER